MAAQRKLEFKQDSDQSDDDDYCTESYLISGKLQK
jgi:hypothetical protein